MQSPFGVVATSMAPAPRGQARVRIKPFTTITSTSVGEKRLVLASVTVPAHRVEYGWLFNHRGQTYMVEHQNCEEQYLD